MRATMDFGIDLGTTNSAVAVIDEGRVQVIKNNDNQEITPSVVQLLSSGAVIVGRKAFEHYRAHGEGDAHMGAKRQMGKADIRYAFAAAGVEHGPEDLAAEVLKSLRADAAYWAGEEIHAAVITVPAAFELSQCEATRRAATRAGIEQCELVQEPIAAGLAYGYERELDDAYFIVYDLGGGTVDVSLLQIRDSRLMVVGHSGDNFLGGRDWDRRLSELLMERLDALGYNIWAIGDEAGGAFRRRLQTQAEEEKIRLSRVEATEVILDGRLQDADGRPIEAAIPVTRTEFEALISADIERSVELAHALLDGQNLLPSAVSRIVPVGGPTLTPLLRRMLGERLGIKLDTRIDPMTVVARGAAQFAAGVPLRRPAAVAGDAEVLALQLRYPSVSDDTEAPVGGLVPVPEGQALWIELRRSDSGWASGRLPVTEGTFRARVVLHPGRVNQFEVNCFDEAGSRVVVAPDRIAITQGLAAAHPPLSQTVSVVVLDDRHREKVVRMLAKGAALPTVKQRAFRTSRELAPGDVGEALKIHVVEGEDARADLNHHVGWLEITAEQLDRPLPAGSPVEVKLRIDASRSVIASAFVPLLDLTIEDVLQGRNRPGVVLQDVEEELNEEVARARDVGRGRTDDIARIEEAAQKIEHEIDAAGGGDHDAADRASLDLKKLKADVDRLAAETATTRAAQELENQRQVARQLVAQHNDAALQTRLSIIEGEAKQALNSSDPDLMDEVADKFSELSWRALADDYDFWIAQLQQLAVLVQGDRDLEAMLLSGRAALERRDMHALREICHDVRHRLPGDEPVLERLDQIGIR